MKTKISVEVKKSNIANRSYYQPTSTEVKTMIENRLPDRI